MSKSAKGSAFERECCVKLSLWWTQDLPEPREDIFWRTAGSGARAKVRGRKSKQTHGQHGDICAIDPIGQPLIDLLTIELKRGYSKHTIADLLDKPEGAAKQVYEKWIEQAKESHKHAKSNSWLLIVKRDRRLAMAISPIFNEASTKFWCSGLLVGIQSLDEFLQEWGPDDFGKNV